MGEWSANSQDRAKAVWDKLLGFFGDALLRKFDAEPPQEWVEAIDALNDFQLRRGLKRILFSWKGGPPNLPDFVRICRALGEDDFDEGPKTPALPSPTNFSGDRWEIEGNLRLMSHILKTLKADPKALGQIIPCREVRDPSGRFVHLESQASKEQTAATGVLVEYKKAWSQDMREHVDDETGEVANPPLPYRERTWTEVMRRAMFEIQSRAAA